MSGKIKILLLVALGTLAAFAAVGLVLKADIPRSTDILLKAKFIRGNTLDVTGPDGKVIPNKIVNEDGMDEVYYVNGSGAGGASFSLARAGAGFLPIDLI